MTLLTGVRIFVAGVGVGVCIVIGVLVVMPR